MSIAIGNNLWTGAAQAGAVLDSVLVVLQSIAFETQNGQVINVEIDTVEQAGASGLVRLFYVPTGALGDPGDFDSNTAESEITTPTYAFSPNFTVSGTGYNTVNTTLPSTLSGSYTVYAYVIGSDEDPVFQENVTLDTVPPALVSTVPANGSAGVSITGEYSITFSEPPIASGTLTIYNADTDTVIETIPVVQGMIDENSITFTPTSLGPTTSYYILADNIRDVQQNRLDITSSILWTFTTATSITLGALATAQVDTDGLDDFTFTNMALGTPAANRRIFVAYASVPLFADRYALSCTINGVSVDLATQSSPHSTSKMTTQIFWADVPLGETGDIRITTNGTQRRDARIWVLPVYGSSVVESAPALIDDLSTTPASYTWTQNAQGGDIVLAVAARFGGGSATGIDFQAPFDNNNETGLHALASADVVALGLISDNPAPGGSPQTFEAIFTETNPSSSAYYISQVVIR
ncbi:MAG: Ig-like domain-containing protein [Ekhidna sp.]|nr:Ig-like domain-containing protein [Ekhidna sp.]